MAAAAGRLYLHGGMRPQAGAAGCSSTPRVPSEIDHLRSGGLGECNTHAHWRHCSPTPMFCEQAGRVGAQFDSERFGFQERGGDKAVHSSAEYFDDLHEFDPASGNWRRLSSIGGAPRARYMHGLAPAGLPGREGLFIFGGNAKSLQPSWLFNFYRNSISHTLSFHVNCAKIYNSTHP